MALRKNTDRWINISNYSEWKSFECLRTECTESLACLNYDNKTYRFHGIIESWSEIVSEWKKIDRFIFLLLFERRKKKQTIIADICDRKCRLQFNRKMSMKQKQPIKQINSKTKRIHKQCVLRWFFSLSLYFSLYIRRMVVANVATTVAALFACNRILSMIWSI